MSKKKKKNLQYVIMSFLYKNNNKFQNKRKYIYLK